MNWQPPVVPFEGNFSFLKRFWLILADFGRDYPAERTKSLGIWSLILRSRLQLKAMASISSAKRFLRIPIYLAFLLSFDIRRSDFCQIPVQILVLFLHVIPLNKSWAAVPSSGFFNRGFAAIAFVSVQSSSLRTNSPDCTGIMHIPRNNIGFIDKTRLHVFTPHTLVTIPEIIFPLAPNAGVLVLPKFLNDFVI